MSSPLEDAIRETGPALLGYFLRRVNVRDDAADLVSETVVAAWKSARRAPRDPAEIRMWLFGVARNMLRNHDRSAHRRDALVQRLAESVAVAYQPDEDAQEVRAAVDALPESLGELVRLVHWDGFSIEEAAGHLGIVPSTARSRHARAKELLRGALTIPNDGPRHARGTESSANGAPANR